MIMENEQDREWTSPEGGVPLTEPKRLSSEKDISEGKISKEAGGALDVRLKLDKQKIVHRRVLFYGIGVIVTFLYGCFVCILFFKPDNLLKLADITPFAISLEILLGMTPTVLLLFMILSVFRPQKAMKDSDDLDQIKALDVLAKCASIYRGLK